MSNKNVTEELGRKCDDKPKLKRDVEASVHAVTGVFGCLAASFCKDNIWRQLHSLKEMLAIFSDGFYVRDMRCIGSIVGILLERQDHCLDFHKCVSEIIQVFGSEHLWKESHDEEPEAVIFVANFISLLGYFLLGEDILLKSRAQTALLRIVDLHKKEKLQSQYKELDRRPVSMEFWLLCIEESTLCHSMLEILNQPSEAVEITLTATIILHYITHHSDACAKVFLTNNGVENVCSIFGRGVTSGEKSYRQRFWGMQVLWNICNYDVSMFVSKVSVDAVRNLRDLFIDCLLHSKGVNDRQLRNDILELICLIIKHESKVAEQLPNFVRELMMLAIVPEVKNRYAIIEHVKFMETPEDYEMKQLFFTVLLFLGPDAVVTYIVAYPDKLIQAIGLHLYLLDEKNPSDQHLLSYKRVLQLLAMKLMAAYLPKLINVFLDCHLLIVVVDQIKLCLTDEHLKKTSYSYTRDAYLLHLLLILVKSVDSHNPNCIDELVKSDMVTTILRLLSMLIGISQTEAYIDAINEIKLFAFIILAAICDTNNECKLLIGTEGVELLVRYLVHFQNIHNIQIPNYNMMLIAFINCIWCSVVGVDDMERKFSEDHGIVLMLEVLRVVEHTVQSFILRFLLDLAENAENIQSLLNWRGPEKLTFPQLLCQLWQKEERLIDRFRDQKNKTTDSRGPLATKSLQTLKIVPQESHKLSPAILEINESIYTTIHGLVEQMKAKGRTSGAPHPPELMHLPMEYMPVLALIEGYLDHKAGEVWIECLSELDRENLKPLVTDQEYLNSLMKTHLNRSHSTMAFQNQFVELSDEEHRHEERDYYAQMKSWKKPEKLMMKRFFEELTVTSDREAFQAKKDKDQLTLNLQEMKTAIRRLEKIRNAHVSKHRFLY